jgi:hypothetical protein
VGSTGADAEFFHNFAEGGGGVVGGVLALVEEGEVAVECEVCQVREVRAMRPLEKVGAVTAAKDLVAPQAGAFIEPFPEDARRRELTDEEIHSAPLDKVACQTDRLRPKPVPVFTGEGFHEMFDVDHDIAFYVCDLVRAIGVAADYRLSRRPTGIGVSRNRDATSYDTLSREARSG